MTGADLADPFRLMAVLDAEGLGDPFDLRRVEAALAGGITCLQVRGKTLTARKFFEAAVAVVTLCRRHHVPVLVNDRPDIALAAHADGAHVGPDDLPPPLARAVLGPDELLGVSVRDRERLIQAGAANADYLGVGAVRGSGTKPEATVIGLDGVLAITTRSTIAVIAIGGLVPGDAPALRRGGVAGMAVAGGIFAAQDPEQAAAAYRDAWDRAL